MNTGEYFGRQIAYFNNFYASLLLLIPIFLAGIL